MPRISDISRSVVKIVAKRNYDNGQEHSANSACTGFFWKTKKDISLITNWHNVTGLCPNTHAKIGSFYPNILEISYWLIKSRSGNQVKLARRRTSIELYSASSPTWVEHPTNAGVDIVQIPLFTATTEPPEVVALNSVNFEDDWVFEVGADCFVVGYPERLEGEFETPIWKRGSIASEPLLSYQDRAVVLVDTLSNPGMSGAPVIAQSSGILAKSGKLGSDSVLGTWQKFLGVYSGREGDSDIGFQLGRVWKANCLNEILSNGIPGNHPKLS
jgi:trypsin-like peptidase